MSLRSSSLRLFQHARAIYTSQARSISSGLVSCGIFLPGTQIPVHMQSTARASKLMRLLRASQLPREYVDTIEKTQKLPGRIGTVEEEWKSKPWFDSFMKALPPKKEGELSRGDPFKGIKSRHLVPSDPQSLRSSPYPFPMLPSDAETLAGVLALASSDYEPEDIDLFICCSHSPDRLCPPNCTLTHHKLGLPREAINFQLDAVCNSTVVATQVAKGMISSGMCRRALIVGSHLASHVIDRWSPVGPQFGDAGVGLIMGEVPEGYGQRGCSSVTRGELHSAFAVRVSQPCLKPHGGYDAFPAPVRIQLTVHDRQLARKVVGYEPENMSITVGSALRQAGITMDQVRVACTHQPEAWLVEKWRGDLKLTPERFEHSFATVGNVGLASVYANLSRRLHREDSKALKTGDNVLFMAPGAGARFICAIERISPELFANSH